MERSRLRRQRSTPSSSAATLKRNSIGRYYDPTTGQFLTVDAAVDQTEAPYAYVNGDPVDNVDPLGLGVLGSLENAWNTVNPFSSSNYFAQSAENGGLAGTLVQNLDPAYLAVSGYVGAYDAWENGCSLSTVAGDAFLGTVGAVGTVAVGYDAVLFGRGFAEGYQGLLRTPRGRVYSAHYLFDYGPERGIPGSVVDEAIDYGQAVKRLADRTVYYDAKNDVTVVRSDTTGKIMSARRGAP